MVKSNDSKSLVCRTSIVSDQSAFWTTNSQCSAPLFVPKESQVWHGPDSLEDTPIAAPQMMNRLPQNGPSGTSWLSELFATIENQSAQLNATDMPPEPIEDLFACLGKV